MHQKISAGPKRDLYIYFLKGRLKTESGVFQNNFIGNWEEEDDSFLFFSSPALRQIQSLLNR
jgi:ribosomal protein L11 methyltransferase